MWSNWPKNGEPVEGNKQFSGKDMVVAVERLMVMEMSRWYDTFATNMKEISLELAVTFTSLTRAKAE